MKPSTERLEINIMTIRIIEYDVCETCEAVPSKYPLEEGIVESVYRGIKSIIRELVHHQASLSGRRPLDVECGPIGKMAIFQKWERVFQGAT